MPPQTPNPEPTNQMDDNMPSDSVIDTGSQPQDTNLNNQTDTTDNQPAQIDTFSMPDGDESAEHKPAAEPEELAPESSLEGNETEADQEVPQINDMPAEPEAPQNNDTIEPMVSVDNTQQPPVGGTSEPVTDTSPERVSLTDLSSYKPQDSPPAPAVMTTQDSSVPVPDEAAKENIYTEICTQIIKEQEQIIGALAVEQAQQVVGLTVDPVTYHCTVTGDGSTVIDNLIEQYRDFFGHAAVEVCKEAASKFITKLPADALPTSLR